MNIERKSVLQPNYDLVSNMYGNEQETFDNEQFFNPIYYNYLIFSVLIVWQVPWYVIRY